MTTSKLLPAALRPQTFSDFLGQEKNLASLAAQVEASGIPHAILFVGEPGMGKTSLAKIICASIIESRENKLSYRFGYPSPETMSRLDSGIMDYVEIDAAVSGGVEDTRTLVDDMRHVPMVNNSARIANIVEAHKLTKAAQSALLASTEFTPDFAYWMLDTSEPSKIDAALRRRFYIINMGTFDVSKIGEIVHKARLHRFGGVNGIPQTHQNMTDFLNALAEVGITSPGVIIQCAERWLNGVDPREAVTTSTDSKLDVIGIARAVSNGQWGTARTLLEDASKEDAVSLRIVTTSYLKKMMLGKDINQAVRCARAINAIAAVNTFEDTLAINATLAALCGATSIMVG